MEPQQIPLSLYVHLPWCVRKCPYCDFNSHTLGNDAPRERYVDALIADIERQSETVGDRELISVFLGGGTPSLFTPEQIGQVLSAVDRCLSLASDVEITMEANPGTVESGSPAGYRAAGVTRLSVGAQSFNSESLQVLGRIHSVDDIGLTVAAAKDAGFDAINVDLMYGLPGQSEQDALADIEAALTLGIDHISWYQLTLEPNTVFFARPPEGLPDEDRLLAIQASGSAALVAAGFEQYEVSAWARGDAACRHNVNYWLYGDYLAVGAGAHGKQTGADGVRRYQRPANPLSYLNAAESGGEAPNSPLLSPDTVLFEFMLNALRLKRGFDESLFEGRTGIDAGVLVGAARNAVDRGLLARVDGRWSATALGWRFLDDLVAEFLPNADDVQAGPG